MAKMCGVAHASFIILVESSTYVDNDYVRGRDEHQERFDEEDDEGRTASKKMIKKTSTKSN